MTIEPTPDGGRPGTPRAAVPHTGPGRKKAMQTAEYKPPVVPIRIEGVPDELKAATVWVCWRWLRDGERGWTKPPLSARTLRKCDVTDAANLSPFDEALARATAGEVDGIGVSLTAAGLLGVDLDDCRDPQTGVLDEWATERISTLDTYTEVSPSGTGVKLLVRATKPGSRCRAGDVEMYDSGRYFTVTGNTLPDTPATPQPRQDAVNLFYSELFPETGRTAAPVLRVPPQIEATDSELLDVAFRAKNGPKLRRVWDGDTSTYKSGSEADLALCAMLAFYFPDADRLDVVFRQSALYRAKWDRDDYRARTLAKALDGRTEFYTPKKSKRAQTGESDANSTGDAAPRIVVGTDEHRVNDAAMAALPRVADLYQRGGSLVRVVQQRADSPPAATLRRAAGTPVVRDLCPATLRDRLTRAAEWVRIVERKESIEETPAHPPGWCVAAVHAAGEWPGVPRLEAVLTHPVLLPDGSVLAANGYHRDSGLLLRCPPGLALDISDRPGKSEVDAALAVLFDAVHDFPFETPAHRAAWVASLLTPLAWFAFDGPAPLFLIDGNVRGVGKGLLADVVALTVHGGRFAVMTYTNDREELRKRITALAASGAHMVLLDNLAGAVGNDVFDAALTSCEWEDRLLGASRVYNGPLNVVWYATGNNCELRADTGRRTCPIRLETPDERPELRADFRHPKLRPYVRMNRGRLLSAALTILRGWVVAGRPSAGLASWGSFEGWSDVVREGVVWAGLPDPGDARQELHGRSDRDACAMADLLRGLRRIDPDGRGKTTAEVVAAAGTDLALRAAVEDVVGCVDGKKLGYKLRSFNRRNFEGLFLDRVGATGDGVRWAAFPVSEFRRRESSPPSPPSPLQRDGDGGDGGGPRPGSEHDGRLFGPGGGSRPD